MIPSIHLVFTLKDMKDSFGVKFSTDDFGRVLIDSGGMCV